MNPGDDDDDDDDVTLCVGFLLRFGGVGGWDGESIISLSLSLSLYDMCVCKMKLSLEMYEYRHPLGQMSIVCGNLEDGLF